MSKPRISAAIAPVFASVVSAALAPLAVFAAPVATYTVTYRDAPEMHSAQGVVEAVRQTTLSAQVTGQLVALPVQAGEHVKAGQVLARIDARTADQALVASQSQLAEAQAALANAARAHQRNAQLYTQKFLSKAALDQSELELKGTQARAAALAANAGQAATAKTFTVLTAPYDGVVAARPAQVGDTATPGQALLTMFDPAAMRVIATVTQSELALLGQKGPPKSLEPQELRVEANGLVFAVARAALTLLPGLDSATHTATLRLELGAAGAALRPGQFVRVWFGGASARKLLVPAGAILRRSELTAVYVQVEGARMQLRQVRVGEAGPGATLEVLAGLREGERIALDPVRAGLAAN
ncbi:MAG: efflux RND transporter periplasmic adaptor subunit [Pseudomonadota bacterium]